VQLDFEIKSIDKITFLYKEKHARHDWNNLPRVPRWSISGNISV